VKPAEIARLEARLHEPLSLHERIRLLVEIAENLQGADPARGAGLAREGVDLAHAAGDVPGEAHALHALGRNQYSLADYPAVFDSQGTALALFHSLGDLHGESRCRNLFGITYGQLADYGHAFEMYEAALRGFRDTGDLQWQAKVLSNLGTLEIQLGNLDAALELFDQSLELRREVDDYEGAGSDLNNAAFAHVQKALAHRGAGDAASCEAEARDALRLLDRGLALARQHGYERLQAFCLQTMAEAHQALGEPEVALGLTSEFLDLAHRAGDKWTEAYGQACVGEIRFQMKDTAEGIALLRQALEAFDALGSRDEAARVLRILSQAHEASGNLSEALACLRRAGVIEQKLKSEDTERRARALSARRRLDQAAREAERYKRLALEDALTGLANRRQLDEHLGTLMRDARSRGSVITIALADVDHFKGINDHFSHAVGDEVLRCVGEILRSHCRLGDIAGRYGGEEFMLVFRNLEIRPATEICERVRRAVETYDWKSIHPQLRVTLSLGLASSASFEHPEGLVDAADHWLYEAKHHGRNQVQPAAVVIPA